MTNSNSVDPLAANYNLVSHNRASRRAIIDKLVCELTSVLEIAVSRHAAGSSLPLTELVSEIESLALTFAAVDDDNFAPAVENAARFLASLERLRRELVEIRGSPRSHRQKRQPEKRNR
jgi:hypothetical protein